MTKLESKNPATGEIIGSVPTSSREDVAKAVARARAACKEWAALGVDGRAKILLGLGDRVASRAKELSELLTKEMGKPLKDAMSEVKSCGHELDKELAEIAEALAPEKIPGPIDQTIYRDPFGVCAAITPWNFPVAMPHWMVFPALAAGNTVVLKPSEQTPLSGQAYADLFDGLLPDGVLQVVHGADEPGKALVEADVDLIAFTGSRSAGKHIMRAAASGLKRVILELGGKDPMVILDDADLGAAAKFAAKNSFRNAGQVCVSTERIFVPRRIADDFLNLLAEETAKMTVGNGLEPDTRIGPMVSLEQKAHVEKQVAAALKSGARLAAGGAPQDGNFMSPTVLADVTDDMDIARNETFGPVACISVVDSEEEAIQRANDTPFGLGAVIFGTDAGRCDAVARQMTAGMVGINRPVGGARGTPWVGARQSGYGFHGSRDGHRQFTQTRLVTKTPA